MSSPSAAYSGVIHVTTGIRGTQPRLGMGTVFVFLMLLVLVLMLATMLMSRLVAPKITETIVALPAGSVGSAGARKMTAITAAIQQHRNR